MKQVEQQSQWNSDGDLACGQVGLARVNILQLKASSVEELKEARLRKAIEECYCSDFLQDLGWPGWEMEIWPSACAGDRDVIRFYGKKYMDNRIKKNECMKRSIVFPYRHRPNPSGTTCQAS